MKRWPVAVRQWSSGALPGCRSEVQLRLADWAEEERLAEPLVAGWAWCLVRVGEGWQCVGGPQLVAAPVVQP